MQNAVRETMSLCTVIWWNEKNKSNRENTRPFTQRVQNLVHVRDGQLAETADLVEFRVVDNDPNASRLLRDDLQRARVRRGRVPDQVCRQVLVQGDVDFLGYDWVDPMGPGSARYLPGPKSRKASGSKNQNPSWTWRKRQQNREDHHPVVRLPKGSSPGREDRMQPIADVAAVVPRREVTKRAVPGSNAQTGPARARPWRPQLREVEP